MGFLDLARKRFSSRSYLNTSVEKDKLLYLLEAARLAPTAVNKQPFVIYVITDIKTRELLNKAYAREWMAQAPVLLVICGDHSQSWKHPVSGKDHCDIDTAIVVDHITLAASDIGLSTCWICNFDAVMCSSILALPGHIEPIALLPVGYPSAEPDLRRHNTKRKPLSEIIRWV